MGDIPFSSHNIRGIAFNMAHHHHIHLITWKGSVLQVSPLKLFLCAFPVLYSLKLVKSIRHSRLLLHFWWLKEYVEEISFSFALKTILIIPFLVYFFHSVHCAEHYISVISLSTPDLWNSSISFYRSGNWDQRFKRLDKIMKSKSRNPSLVDATVFVFNH